MCDVQAFIPSALKSRIYEVVVRFLITADGDDIRTVATDISAKLTSDTARSAAAATLRQVAGAIVVRR